MKSVHRSVLLNEIVAGLELEKGSVLVDGTFGGGGHSMAICRKFPGVKIIAIDQDQSALESVKEKFQGLNCEIILVNGNFRNLTEILREKNVKQALGVILDLGLSSDQLENSGRGFSFMKNEPLLMTMKENPRSKDLTARDIVNDWSEASIEKIIYGYGEERYAKKITHGIIKARKQKEIQTTNDLVKIIIDSVPKSYIRSRINPATKTFQALRIAVNDELGALEVGLKQGLEVLKTGGRMLVISFHSLEDRVVKKFYKTCAREGKVKLINKKPITASPRELKENPRARSAKLRILEKT